ncbi:MAG: histidinol dehydrogenase [Ignavibacteriaceae bacterium]|nr:histidinol dehydrogenase [Ignavibacteriaceae bacterium]
MRIYTEKKLSREALAKLTGRKASAPGSVMPVVRRIISDVKRNGFSAVQRYNKRFDNNSSPVLKVSAREMNKAEGELSPQLKQAMKAAFDNITRFHEKQKPAGYTIRTMPGVRCSMEYRPIERAGLYIPGGSAPLPSTMLMLGIPARIAGCKEIFVFTLAPEGRVHPAVLYAATLCGITAVFKAGGAHAIAAAAYGTEQNRKAYKIFGPGNRYVTAAKILVSSDPEGAAIDFPAGPSEVLVIADEMADPVYIAADLLSQAEHGPDSRAVCLVFSEKKAKEVAAETRKQLTLLPRKEIAVQALQNSFILVCRNIESAIAFSNETAPEHLILNMEQPENYLPFINNAGSVFLGAYSPESGGDYASGTNHSLPTEGYAKVYGGVTVNSFMKSMTVQKITKKGIEALGKTVITLAEAEGLEAHARAVKVRMQK